TFTMQLAPNLVGVVPQFGVHDALFAGNFPQVAVTGGVFANGFAKLGAYGFDATINAFRWLIDTDGDGVADIGAIQPAGAQINGIPIAGNFDGNAANGDELALF